MSFRRLTVSALFVAGLFAVSAAGQPPGGAPERADDTPGIGSAKQPPGEKAKPADPADAAVTAALANDPDVKVARAKVQLAEAELAKARQAVVLKVMTLTTTIKEHKASVAAQQARVGRTAELNGQGVEYQSKLLDERARLEIAQAALARAETELKLLTGDSGKEPGGELPDGNAEAVARGLEWLARSRQGNLHGAALLALR